MKQNLKSQETRKKLRMGGYSAGLVCIVLALLVIVNLIVGAVPTKYTHLDASTTQLYTLSEETCAYLKDVEQDITLYLVTENGTENNDIYEILSKYAAENDHLRIVVKDPSLYPNFTKTYTDATLSNNSIIVESGEKFKVIDANNLFSIDYEAYYSTGETNYSYEGEGLITSAISYVTENALPALYLLTGHGETALSDSLMTSIKNKNYVVTEEFSLLSAGAVPEECDILLINAPTKDLSEQEAEQILDYLEAGGRLVLFTLPTETELPNLMRVTEHYGMTAQNGVVFDNDSDHYYENYMIPIAEKQEHEITSAQIEKNTYTLMPYSHGIKLLEEYRSSLTVSALLETSDAAYLKTNIAEIDTYEKQDGDLAGGFCLGATAEEVYGDATTRLVWYPCAIMEYYDALTGGANADLILTSLDWAYGEEAVGVNVPSKSLAQNTMVLTASDLLLWIGIMVILIPIGCIVFGFVYWLKRRKR